MSDDNEPELDPADNGYDRGKQDAMSSGVKVRGKITRGNDPRDKDVLLLEGRGATAAEAAEDFEATLQRAEEQSWAQRLRDLQPSEGDDE